MAKHTIIQFGTSRFLQAHVDLFAAEAAMGGEQDVPPIIVVQTSGDPKRAARVGAFGRPEGYPVVVRGLDNDDTPSDRTIVVRSISLGLQAARDWDHLVTAFVTDAGFVVSNTGDTGYEVHDNDRRPDLLTGAGAPRSFPAILLVLLYRRWSAGGAPITLLPCELVRRNADVLKAVITGLASAAGGSNEFLDWLGEDCLWVNTLVDRIVSEPIEPIGAVAEPYALWAVERQPGLEMPFHHPAIELTDDLDPYERLKLHILNLGHSWLAQRWLDEGSPAGKTVGESLADPATREALERLYAAEVVPGFALRSLGKEAEAYVATTLRRFTNPYLDHRLADIAVHHSSKIEKRVASLLAWIDETGSPPDMPELRMLTLQGQKVVA